MDIYQKATKFYQAFQGDKRIIGKSIFARKIYAVKVGDGFPVGIAQYAIHGREFITAELAFLHARVGVFQGSLWIVPLVNPDGALLSEIGLSSVSNEKAQKRLLSLNAENKDFSLWKANARGVDLNVNFPVRWGQGNKNVRIAGSENYIGTKPLSEPESRALRGFTERIKPDYTVSYHTKGEEIYWYFSQDEARRTRDEELALSLSKATGYPLKMSPGSVGGYKDWCIDCLKIPSFTIEVGKDAFTHPLGMDALADFIEKNIDVLDVLSKAYFI